MVGEVGLTASGPTLSSRSVCKEGLGELIKAKPEVYLQISERYLTCNIHGYLKDVTRVTAILSAKIDRPILGMSQTSDESRQYVTDHSKGQNGIWLIPRLSHPNSI
jgi:hypothetical protein